MTITSRTYKAGEYSNWFGFIEGHDLHIGGFELELRSESHQRFAITLKSTDQLRSGFVHDPCGDVGQYLPVIGLVTPSVWCAKEHNSEGVVP